MLDFQQRYIHNSYCIFNRLSLRVKNEVAIITTLLILSSKFFFFWEYWTEWPVSSEALRLTSAGGIYGEYGVSLGRWNPNWPTGRSRRTTSLHLEEHYLHFELFETWQEYREPRRMQGLRLTLVRDRENYEAYSYQYQVFLTKDFVAVE